LIFQEIKMKKMTALALVSSLFMLAACDSMGLNSDGAGGSGAAGTGQGVLGQHSDGQNVSDRVFFAFDSSVLTAESQASLDRQSQWLKQYPSVNVVIEGHADERGTREYNLALGERRADAARNYLISSGIASSRVSTISYGKERPAVMGHDESAWSQNRRAVTVIAN
jgi:peptidoglycan-associated lipoprotein